MSTKHPLIFQKDIKTFKFIKTSKFERNVELNKNQMSSEGEMFSSKFHSLNVFLLFSKTKNGRKVVKVSDDHPSSASAVVEAHLHTLN